MDVVRDAQGLTEEEFLAQYQQRDYPKPSLTADVALFRYADDCWQVLLIRRGGHPFLGCWALPGGFVGPGEDCDQAALRELFEETHVSGIPLEQYGLYSTPGRDPRAWTVSGAYFAKVDEGVHAIACDDAADARWFALRLEDADAFAGGCAYNLYAEAPGIQLHTSFVLAAGVYEAPRAQVVSATGFAFDHARLVADAFVRIAKVPAQAVSS